MTDDDLKHMQAAISLAERCTPTADRIPKVGAIIAIGGVVIGGGHRGSGVKDDDEHAEKNALAVVHDRSQLSKATVYTTLEPCTPGVRSNPLDCCTELLYQAGVSKVFIGILDPNQGVTGKGLWELQSRGIDVELFPPDLARSLRTINDKFIREQQSLGIRITNTQEDQVIRTYDQGGTYTIEGTFLNPPGGDVFALTSDGAHWWPQPYPLNVTENKHWSVKLHFGGHGRRVISIIRATELGEAMIKYYFKITGRHAASVKSLEQYALDKGLKEHIAKFKEILGGSYPPVDMARLPKGIQVQAQVTIILDEPPK
jgi:pyrimidine deaminase RibD-like protein